MITFAMDKNKAWLIRADLHYLTLFPKRYDAPKGKDADYWRNVGNRYCNMEKTIKSSDLHWRVIEYDDGRKELAYLRVLQGGFSSGLYPAIYRGLIFPRKIGRATFANIKNIRLAF